MVKEWIWQSPNYPHFSYDETILNPLLDEILKNEERLKDLIVNNELDETNLQIQNLSNEIISSAEIEGEVLKRESVRSSLRKKLDENFNHFNDNFSTKQSDNYVNILLDTNLNKNSLTIERLNGWHNALFESGYSGFTK